MRCRPADRSCILRSQAGCWCRSHRTRSPIVQAQGGAKNPVILLPDADEIVVELVSGRGASANFDMQSLASVEIGDRVVVRRSEFRVRFLHPRGWSYFDTLRKKLHWNEGGS